MAIAKPYGSGRRTVEATGPAMSEVEVGSSTGGAPAGAVATVAGERPVSPVRGAGVASLVPAWMGHAVTCTVVVH